MTVGCSSSIDGVISGKPHKTFRSAGKRSEIMESNRDEALKCLAIAQRHRDAGNYGAARRFCEKSLGLFSTPEALRLSQIIDTESTASSSSSSTPSSSTTSSTATETHPSASTTKHRNPVNGNANGEPVLDRKREYTAEHVAIVKRVRGCKVTEYYEILALSKECDENDVKKAYRKLALQLHPDKNGAPGADEAFKMVSKAFQILSDPQKRAAFDQHGADPDSRFSGMSAASGRRSTFAAGPRFDGEMSPEDLFNMFFGGGGAQFATGGFGGGNTFTASFGGPAGFTQFRSGGRRPAPGRQEAASNDPRTVFLQLLPLLAIVLFSLLTSLPSIIGSFQTPDPAFSFAASDYYSQGRTTAMRNVPYYVNPTQFTRHPIWESIAVEQRQNPKAGLSSRKLKDFESKVESSYIGLLRNKCHREEDDRERRMQDKIGLFGFGTDWDLVRRIRDEQLPSCAQLADLSRSPY